MKKILQNIFFTFLLIINTNAFTENTKNITNKTDLEKQIPQKKIDKSTLININKANLEQLSKLKKIGTKKALKIIEFRKQNGDFQDIEDLLKIKGISTKILNLNKDIITIK